MANSQLTPDHFELYSRHSSRPVSRRTLTNCARNTRERRGNHQLFKVFHCRFVAEEILMKKAIMSLVALSFICGVSLSVMAPNPASACWWKDRHYQP